MDAENATNQMKKTWKWAAIAFAFAAIAAGAYWGLVVRKGYSPTGPATVGAGKSGNDRPAAANTDSAAREQAAKEQERVAKSIAEQQAIALQNQQKAQQSLNEVQKTLKSIEEINRINRQNQQMQQQFKPPK